MFIYTNRLLEMMRQGSIKKKKKKKVIETHFECISHIKTQDREIRGGGGQELRELVNRRQFKGKSEKNRGETEGEKEGWRGGE